MLKKTFFLVVTISLSKLFCFSQATPQYEGIASYYNDKFHLNRTSSGELYHKDSLTAAHPTLPFNTLVKVSNLNTGNSVIVRINDRGPFSKTRIIDVSKAAAKELGMLRSGIIKVKIEVIHKEEDITNEGLQEIEN
jgi:rare lipoprotein A